MGLIELTGARRIPFIGRRELLAEAERRIGRGGIHLIHLEGTGGIGKTALLETILERTQRGPRAESMAACCTAREVIDLYQVDVHTTEGLIREIIHVLGRWHFEQSEGVLNTLDGARTSGDADAVAIQSKLLQTAFFEEFTSLTRDGVILAFDTLEVLEYEHDAFQEELGIEMPIASAGEWLFQSFLPALNGNVVLLMAGRPGSLRQKLEGVRECNRHLLIHHTDLAALTEAETKEYLMTVAQAEGKRGDSDAASRLWTYSEERCDVVHYLTGGRPILLSIVADMIARDWTLPPAFGHRLEELEKQGPDVWWTEVERALVVRIQESPTPIGETLQALAWLRKGATPELLARVMDLKTADGQWDVYSASGYLEQVSQMALVKVRSGTGRVYLHDEMYTLLTMHVLQRFSEDKQARIHLAIRDYYREQAQDMEARIEQFPPGLSAIQTRLRQSYVEEMHYRLCHNPPMGYAMYFWLAEEALGSRDAEMDMLLRTEFLRTLGRLKEHAGYIGHVPRDAEVDIAVRWGMRALFLQDNPVGALNILDEVRRRWGKDMGRIRLSWVHLQLYTAVAQIQRGEGEDWTDARALLLSVERTANETLASPPESPVVRAHRWQAQILKSLALNYRGYLDRQEGRYLEAVKNYRASAILQRRLAMGALIPTLTNLSYAMAITGETHHARLLAEEAERLSRRSGKEHMLALAMNVRALIETYDNHHRTALSYADRALEVAARLPSTRVRGLIHLTRARAHRYLGGSLTEDERAGEPLLYQEALKEANQAVNLLRSSPADRVEALLERGCVYRDLARHLQLLGTKEEASEYADRGRKDLERVAVLAGAVDLPRQQSAAWTNLGWLHYFVGQTDQIPDALELACTMLPKDYKFPQRGPVPPIAQNGQRREATLPYWTTLGKTEMLRAYVALDQISGSKDQEAQDRHLHTAIKHMTLSLAYDELVANSFFDLSRAEKGLHARILQERLSLKSLHQHAKRAAEDQDLVQPTRFQQFLTQMFGPADLWI